MKKYLFLFLFIVVVAGSKAQDIYGGDISYANISGLEYQITITLYTKTSAPGDRPTLDSVSFGDGGFATLTRTTKVAITADISMSTYVGTHTYPGSGNYDPHTNPNGDYLIGPITNFPDSTPRSVDLIANLTIDPSFAADNSPVLHNVPVFYAPCCGPFIYNDSAFDVDGDSLSYSLLSYDSTYSFYGATIDSLGNLFFTPPKTCLYLFNIQVSDWRKVGSTFHQLGSMMRRFVVQVDSFTLVEEINKTDFANAFPNPAANRLTVTTNTNPEYSGEIILYDILSRKLLQQKFTGSVSLNIENLSKGIYLYEVRNENGRVGQGKVVKE